MIDAILCGHGNCEAVGRTWACRFWHLYVAARMDLRRAELLHYALASSDNATNGGHHGQLSFNLTAEGESA